MRQILVLLAILVMFGSMKEHKVKPCAGGKLVIKSYSHGKLVHTDYDDGVYVEWNRTQNTDCSKHRVSFAADSIVAEIVK